MMTDKQSKEQFKKSPYIRRYLRIAWAIPFVIVAISIFVSINQSDWGHFSRAGSLIVVLGIYIAIKDLSGDIYEHARNNYFTMSEFFKIGDIGIFEKEELNELINKAKEVEKTNSENNAFATYVSKKFRKIEAVLLVVGTIIWGYGDLILSLIWKFKA